MLYWEAWRIEPGARAPASGSPYTGAFESRTTGEVTFTYNDFFSPSPYAGYPYIAGLAGFYEGYDLPDDFVTNNDATFAGSLPSTTTEPELPSSPDGECRRVYVSGG